MKNAYSYRLSSTGVWEIIESGQVVERINCSMEDIQRIILLLNLAVVKTKNLIQNQLTEI